VVAGSPSLGRSQAEGPAVEDRLTVGRRPRRRMATAPCPASLRRCADESPYSVLTARKARKWHGPRKKVCNFRPHNSGPPARDCHESTARQGAWEGSFLSRAPMPSQNLSCAARFRRQLEGVGRPVATRDRGAARQPNAPAAQEETACHERTPRGHTKAHLTTRRRLITFCNSCPD
jgi:hypothetical protein